MSASEFSSLSSSLSRSEGAKDGLVIRMLEAISVSGLLALIVASLVHGRWDAAFYAALALHVLGRARRRRVRRR